MKAVILAGGSGERFWPMSTSSTPKQFLSLFGGSTLIEQTYERIRMRFRPEDILIVTSSEHSKRTEDLLSELPKGNVIGEPVRRNTAPACVLAALASDRDEIQLVVPADHRLPDPEAFWKAFDLGVKTLEESGGLFTFGIEPTRPDTGYGYIEVGEMMGDTVFAVRRFVEKPDIVTAKDMIRKGDFYWNSGMFVWRAGEFLDEIMISSPDIMKPMADLDPRNDAQLSSVYSEIPNRSVDYGVMEISKNVRMIKGSFDWSDVGNWASIIELNGYTEGDPGRLLVDSERIFIRSGSERPIGIVGLKGILVIETEEGLLICSEDHVQKVREISKRVTH